MKHPLHPVERRARELLAEVGVQQAPIPLDIVAAHMGLEVTRAVFGDDVSGILVVEDGHGVIGVNGNHALVRQRFTIAHEIGHFMLHRDQLPMFIETSERRFAAAFRDGDSATGEHRREVEANGFAAALLMPIDFLRVEIDALSPVVDEEEVIAILADRFKVSKSAMTYRLGNVFGLASAT